MGRLFAVHPIRLAMNHVNQGIKGKDVVQGIKSLRLFADGCLKRNRVYDGPKFIPKNIDKWAHENGVALDFSRPRNAGIQLQIF